MKLTISIIIALTFLFSFNLKAQNLGYLGKKLSVDIGASVSPSFAKAQLSYPSMYYDSASKKTKEFRSVSLRVYPEVNISYAIGRRIEIAGRFGYQRYKLNYDFFYLQLQDDTINNWYPNDNYVLSSGGYYIKDNRISTSQTILTELSLRYYFKPFIAPVGNYITFGYGIYFSRLVDNDSIDGQIWDHYSSSNSNYSYGEYKIENTWNPMKRITLGYHSKKVYGKSIYSDIGIEMSFSTKGKYQYKNRQSESATSYLQYGYIGNLQRRYLIWENLATVKFAIGKIF